MNNAIFTVTYDNLDSDYVIVINKLKQQKHHAIHIFLIQNYCHNQFPNFVYNIFIAYWYVKEYIWKFYTGIWISKAWDSIDGDQNIQLDTQKKKRNNPPPPHPTKKQTKK